MSAERILTRLFGRPETINGGGRCPTYLVRWKVFRRRSGFAIYIHHFVGDDWTLDFHDHPKRFISIGLRGWYIEETPEGREFFWAPWIRSFPASHLHRITTPSKSCWTLVITLKIIREWGFWHDGSFIPWRKYVAAGSEIADRMKSCP